MRFECLLRYPAKPAARCKGYVPDFKILCSVGADAEGSTCPEFDPSADPAVLGCRIGGDKLFMLTVFRDGESDRESLASGES